MPHVLRHSLRSLAFCSLLLAGMSPALRAAEPAPLREMGETRARVFEGLLEHIDGNLSRGSDEAARAVIEALERHPASPTLADPWVHPLREVLRRNGKTDLVQRLSAMRWAKTDEASEKIRPLEFPRDHGAHLFHLAEWWYFTGQLYEGEHHYGFEFAMFKTGFGLNVVHAALTDVPAGTHPYDRRFFLRPKTHHRADRLENQFGADRAWMDDAGVIHLDFPVRGHRIELALEPKGSMLHVNGNAWIQMPEGGGSYYYSMPRCDTRGRITFADGHVAPVTGQSWFDHQWGNFWVVFGPWDWFSFQMADGTNYNLFHFREDFVRRVPDSANRQTAAGQLSTDQRIDLERKEWWKSPLTGDHYVTRWEVRLPAFGERFDVTTPVADQEMPRAGWYDPATPYWEGTIRVRRHNADGSVTDGVGYAEHMPYRKPWPRKRDAQVEALGAGDGAAR